MGLEVTTTIAGLVATNPTAGDPKAQGDDHLRLLKVVLQAEFQPYSHGTNGYIHLPGGLIAQWGISGAIGTGATGTVVYPIPFTTAVYNIQATYSNATGGQGGNPFNAYSDTLAQFKIINGGAGSAQYFWLAIGK
jgi:hypothetical protein